MVFEKLNIIIIPIKSFKISKTKMKQFKKTINF